jgi:outer membrane beta-barrel protein
LNRYLYAASLVLLLAGERSWAQFEGLDLSDDAAKKDEPKKDSSKKKKVDDDSLDLGGPSKPASKEAADDRKPLTKKDDGPVVERDVTQEDRVKSVQRKLYLKRGRFEIAPAFSVNINDAYYTKMGGQLRAAFYPADTLAIAARFSLIQTLPTDDVRTAKRNLSSRIFFSVPIWDAMADLEWSPLYGKVAIFNSILHFDGYFIGGGGVVFTETSAANDASRSGVKPAFDLGIGLRFITKDWLAVNVSLVNTAYVDTPTGTTQSALQNMMMINVGVSIFFPLKSTFREAE